jgi:drug/metabolite transporter (DMT)-like permease
MQKGITCALIGAVLFGVSTPLAKSLLGVLPPLMMAGLLYAGSGLGLLLLLAGRATLSASAPMFALPRRGEWRWLAGAIFVGGIVGPVLLMYGLAATAASSASLLLNLETVFTVLLAWFAFHEHFSKRVAVGIFAIVAGSVVLGWTPGDWGHASLGPLLIAGACLCWAVDNNLTRKVAASDAVIIAGLKGIVAGTVNLTLALLLGEQLPDPGTVARAAVVGFLGYGLSLALFVVAMRHLGTARASAYFAVAPFFGAAVAIPLLGDVISWQLVAAGGLMAAGVWLHVTERHDHWHVHEPLEHAHAHVHDEHHRHEHDFAWDGSEPHTHPHVHARLAHTHPHSPDVHHRHTH